MEGGSSPVEIQRAEASHAADGNRPRAARSYVREMVEAYDEPVDGAYLHELLSDIADEILLLTVKERAAGNRELLMVEAKLREAFGWAIAFNQKKGRIMLLDRRRFTPPDGVTEFGRPGGRNVTP